MSIVKYYNFKDSECFIFDHFVVNQIKEGVIVNEKNNEQLNEVIQKHFTGKDLIYISNRVNSYSVNPLIYTKAQKIPNLIAIGIIPLTNVMRKNAEYEREFFDKPYEIFNTLSSALDWAQKLLK